MMLKNLTLLAIAFTLTGCNTADYTISKTEVMAGKCTFTVNFPEDYGFGPERGTQTFTVAPYIGRQSVSALSGDQFTLEGQTEGIGPGLRRKCAGFLLEPVASAKSK